MPQDPYKQILDDQSYGTSRRGRLRSRYGEVDRASLVPMENTMGTLVEGLILGRQKEIARRSAELEKNFISEKLGTLEQSFRRGRRDPMTGQAQPLSGGEINSAIDNTTLELLRYGGDRARTTAGDIHKLRKAEKMDTSLTLEEAYLRGQIPLEKYKEAKQAGKTEKTATSKLRWRQAMDEKGKPRTELVDKKTHLVEEEIDESGKLTGSTRLKGVTKPGSASFGFGSGGKGSLDIPFINPTTNKIQYRKAVGFPDDIRRQIKMNAKAIDSAARKFTVSGGKGWLPNLSTGKGFGSEASWEDYLDGKANIDNLPSEVQPLATALDELSVRADELDGLVAASEDGAPQPEERPKAKKAAGY